MARGSPDFGMGEYYVSINNFDSNDIVAAIMHMGRLDNKGRIFFFDDFSNGLSNWQLAKVGTGVLPYVSGVTKYGFVSGFSARFDVSNLNDDSSLTRTFLLPPTTTLGIEIGIHMTFARSSGYVQFSRRNQVGNNYVARLYYDHDTQSMRIAAVEGNINVGSVLNLASSTDSWLQYKLVLDLASLTYKRFVMGLTSLDISQYHMKDAGSASYDILTVGNNQLSSIGTDFANIGAVLVTVDEP